MRAIHIVASSALLAGTFAAVVTERGNAIVKAKSLSVLESFNGTHRRAPFPPRMAGAIGGRALLARTAPLPPARREAAIFSEIVAGNVPDHLRTLVPVRLVTRDARGRKVTATAWVLPDYLAVGSNQDFVRVPVNLETASRIAVYLGMALPTPKIVDDIYAAADFRLTPQPMPASRDMTSNAFFVRHHDAIESVLRPRLPVAQRSGLLLAGHKKDVVLSTRLERREPRLALFGWHRPSGKPIQPLNTTHDFRYTDYSHGIRLVATMVYADGRDMPIEEALSDRALAPLFSYEGRFRTYGSILETAARGGSQKSRMFASLAP